MHYVLYHENCMDGLWQHFNYTAGIVCQAMSKEHTYNGIEFQCVNSPILQSEIRDELSKLYGMGDVYYYKDTNTHFDLKAINDC